MDMRDSLQQKGSVMGMVSGAGLNVQFAVSQDSAPLLPLQSPCHAPVPLLSKACNYASNEKIPAHTNISLLEQKCPRA